MRKVIVACVAIALLATVGAVADVEKLQEHNDDSPGVEYQVGMAAPGATQILEDFEGGTPPANWTVVDNAGAGVIWNTAAFWGMTNNTNGSGEAASCDSDAAGNLPLDTELITESYDFCGATGAGLNLQLYYENYANWDFLDIDVSMDGGASWDTILSWNEDHGAEDVSLDLSAYDGMPSVMIRAHYYCPGCEWVWYVQVDNFELTSDGTIVPGVGTCSPGGDGGAVPATSTTGAIILAVLLMIGGSLFVVLRRRTA